MPIQASLLCTIMCPLLSVNDPKESERRIQKLTETKEKLAKSVNMRAMNMLGKAEEQVPPNSIRLLPICVSGHRPISRAWCKTIVTPYIK